MKPRKFKHRIEVWRNDYDATYDDDAGGNTGGPGVLVGSSWCNVRSIPQAKLLEYGLDENRTGIAIRVRHRTDLDYNNSDLFFKYKGKRYDVSSIAEKDLEERYFDIIAQA